MDNLEEYCDDVLAYEHLSGLGIDVETVSWRQNADWSDFDWVVVRSTWDYQSAAAEFFEVLDAIQGSSAKLANPLRVMRWNMHKRYLLELEAIGIPIVPTRHYDHLDKNTLRAALSASPAGCVVKPPVSASADRTFWLTAKTGADEIAAACSTFANTECLLQPFQAEIQTIGEYSVFFFAGEYSHTIVKKPTGGDFRVQEEHGGDIQVFEPSAALLKRATEARDALSEPCLYVRADFVPVDNDYLLMELELIEPSLYLRIDPAAPTNFANACRRWFDQH